MKNKIITAAVASAVLAALAVAPAFAATSTTTRAETRDAAKAVAAQQKMAKAGDRGSKEIDARISNLNSLLSRVDEFKNISDAQKASVTATIQSLVNELTTLKAKIQSDTSTTTAKEDVQSITKDYRVYALVMPQLNIIAASDRVVTIAAMMQQVAAKIQTRLASASGISNLSALQADLADISAKISDANTQAEDAVKEVASLLPDQGNKTVMQSNTSALKDARTKIQAAQKDLTAARKDAQTIIAAFVKEDKNMMKETSTTSVSGGSTGTTTGTTTGTSSSTSSTTTP